MTGDRIASLACVIIAVVFGFQTSSLHYNGKIFPLLICVFLFVLSVFMFTHTFLKKHPEQKHNIPACENLLYITGTIAVVLVWIHLLSLIGFIFMSVVSLTALTLMLDLRRITFNRAVFTLAVYTVVVVVLWLIFYKILLVPLPSGYLL